MNKNKIRHLLLAPIFLILLLVSCTNNKSNDNGQSQTESNQKIFDNSSTPTQPPSATPLTQLPSATPLTQPPIPTPLTQPQNSAKPAQESGILTTSNTVAQPAKYTDAAKFLAGMKVDSKSSLTKSENDKSWQAHATFFNNAWNKLENQQLSKVRKWASTELVSLNQFSGPIFYPFSGPDFLYLYSFFPKGSEYVLVGLEPVGEIPNLDKISDSSEIGTNLHWLESSMADVMQLSFFKTKAMAKDLKESKLKGVLPILFVFLARTNNTIQDVNYINLNKDGTIELLNSSQKSVKNKKLPSGVKIDFVPAGEYTTRSLYYFSTDLSNNGLQNNPEFTKFIQSLAAPITYLKAASYLLHEGGFSNIRNLILAQSNSLLQDDSGVPIKYFNHSKWNLKFYGNYTKPIALFSSKYQSDLNNVYKSNKNIKQLDFGIGYQFRVNQSNLMLATSK